MKPEILPGPVEMPASEPASYSSSADDPLVGFEVESYSAPDAPIPDDTTARPARPLAPVAGEGPGAEVEVEGEGEDEGEAPGEPQAAAPPTETPEKKSRREKKRERYEENYRLRKQAETENARLTARLEALERRMVAGPGPGGDVPFPARPSAPLPPGTPSAPAARSSEAKSPRPIPPFPTLESFEKAEDFEVAVRGWTEDRRREILDEVRGEILPQTRAEILAAVDARAAAAGAELRAQVADAAYLKRLTAVQTAHPDFTEVTAGLEELKSSWYDAAKHGPVPTPFLSDVVANTETGPELLYWLGAHPEEAHVLAELRPTTAMKDAVLESAHPERLLPYFATRDGQRVWAQLLQVPRPQRLFQELGRLEAYLDADTAGQDIPAGDGSPAGGRGASRTAISTASPPVRLPAGTPSGGSPPGEEDFETFVARKAQEPVTARLRLAGVT